MGNMIKSLTKNKAGFNASIPSTTEILSKLNYGQSEGFNHIPSSDLVGLFEIGADEDAGGGHGHDDEHGGGHDEDEEGEHHEEEGEEGGEAHHGQEEEEEEEEEHHEGVEEEGGDEEEDNDHAETPPTSITNLICPLLPLEGHKEFIDRVNSGVPCLSMGALPEAEEKCCQGIARVWVLLKDVLEDKLISSVQQPHQMLMGNTFSKRATATLGEFGVAEPAGMGSLTPLINDCKIWSHLGSLDCTESFSVGPSINGLVYSLNRPSLQKVLTTKGNSLFTEKLGPEPHGSPLDLHPGQFVFSADFIHDLESEGALSNPTFDILIHDPNDIPDFMGNVIRLETGKSYSVKIKPIVSVADSSLKGMDVEERHCLFSHEKELKLFKNYTRSACLLECQIQNIRETCHCLPWDLIHDHDMDTVPPCVKEQLQCPQDVIARASDHGCDCPFDCNSVKYGYAIQHSCFSPKAFCKELEETQDLNYFGLLGNWGSMMPDVKHANPCYTATQYGVKVTVSYEDSIATKVTKSKRTTFAGMVSSLGKKYRSKIYLHCDLI